MRGPASGGGSGWSRDARFVCPGVCHARIFLDTASLRGMTEPPHQVRNDIVVGISLKLVLWNAPEYALCSAAIPPPLSGREEASRLRNEGEDSPITAAALLGSFFSLQRRMNITVSPALDAGSRESRREIYSRSLLSVSLDSASWRGMTECRRAKCHREHR